MHFPHQIVTVVLGCPPPETIAPPPPTTTPTTTPPPPTTTPPPPRPNCSPCGRYARENSARKDDGTKIVNGAVRFKQNTG